MLDPELNPNGASGGASANPEDVDLKANKISGITSGMLNATPTMGRVL